MNNLRNLSNIHTACLREFNPGKPLFGLVHCILGLSYQNPYARIAQNYVNFKGNFMISSYHPIEYAQRPLKQTCFKAIFMDVMKLIRSCYFWREIEIARG